MDEVLALKSIYSAPGELQIKARGNVIGDEAELESFGSSLDEVEMKVSIIVSHTFPPVDVYFRLSSDYPQTPPLVEVTCTHITGEMLKKITKDVRVFLESNTPNHCLFDSIEYCRGILLDTQAVFSKPSGGNCDEYNTWCYGTLVILDHMRNENGYIKTLKRWTDELCLRMTVVNCGLHNIYAQILAKDKQSINLLMKQWRTVCVDVDSHGRPCKEHLLTVVSTIAKLVTIPAGTSSTNQRFQYYANEKRENLKNFILKELLPLENVQLKPTS